MQHTDTCSTCHFFKRSHFTLQIACHIVTALLHLFFMASFSWMLVEGLLLWSKVVSVNISEDSRMKLYYIIGWGKIARSIKYAMSAFLSPETKQKKTIFNSVWGTFFSSTCCAAEKKIYRTKWLWRNNVKLYIDLTCMKLHIFTFSKWTKKRYMSSTFQSTFSV